MVQSAYGFNFWSVPTWNHQADLTLVILVTVTVMHFEITKCWLLWHFCQPLTVSHSPSFTVLHLESPEKLRWLRYPGKKVRRPGRKEGSTYRFSDIRVIEIDRAKDWSRKESRMLSYYCFQNTLLPRKAFMTPHEEVQSGSPFLSDIPSKYTQARL